MTMMQCIDYPQESQWMISETIGVHHLQFFRVMPDDSVEVLIGTTLNGGCFYYLGLVYTANNLFNQPRFVVVPLFQTGSPIANDLTNKIEQ